MNWHNGMNQAIAYIEDHLTGDMDLAIAAQYAGCSVWEFQRVFSFMTHLSLGEYIRRRKLTLAANDLQSCDGKIIDIALKYGYDSPAAFSRAFHQWHGMTPSSARSEGVPLKAYSRITFQSTLNGWSKKMSSYSERGYVIRENGPVYFTRDMDKTLEWFQNTLGWYGDIVARDSAGRGDYGCVFDYPSEIAVAHITPFRGFHLFTGEPVKGVVGFLMVEGIDTLHSLVKNSGWNQISDIEPQPWGARECSVTTPDGSILRFFETKPSFV
ncbi:helix-turn-helix domain-containing protein [Gorillibacterium timonense]|uniref:helix-turn-helix domain-containing protein n=1 Tax=Gorillibacterium timonense TaxID=1689269 RepID=UPI00071CB164|nr:helix-turn-helix domain-containing protein [Gorillibacterium timonense]